MHLLFRVQTTISVVFIGCIYNITVKYVIAHLGYGHLILKEN